MTVGKEKQKILIVDDTPGNIDVLSAALKKLDLTVAAATSGERALKVLATLKPDLILLDVMMPGIDGFETCRRIKAMKEFADVPIIFVTAKTETSDILTGFSVGGVDYILKPFCHEEVAVRVKTHLLLRKTQLDLRNLNFQKNRFLGMAAHDLRNPLGAVRGYAEYMMEDADDISRDERDSMLRDIHASCNEMLFIVNDLLDVSAIETGHLDLRKTNFDLAELIAERVRAFRFSAARKNIGIRVNAQGTPLDADRNRIAQVLDNLLSNAIKFSPPDLDVEVTAKRLGKWVELSVRDHGPGITADDRMKMFKDFQTLSAQPTGNEKSTGLGLVIVKKVVEAHAGKITVTSGSVGGAEFMVRLPSTFKDVS